MNPSRTDLPRTELSHEAHDRAPRLVLVGLRASGKSTVGPLLAARLDLPFHDSDARLVENGFPPGETIRTHGIETFRRHEAECIAALAALPRGVIALGGGAIETDAVRTALAGWTAIHLDAPDDELARRLRAPGSSDRPALTELPLEEEIAALRRRRASLYSAIAPVMIDTGGKAVAAVVDEIVAALGLEGDSPSAGC